MLVNQTVTYVGELDREGNQAVPAWKKARYLPDRDGLATFIFDKNSRNNFKLIASSEA